MLLISEQRRCAAAETLLKRTLELRKTILGKWHPETLMGTYSFATVVKHQEQHEQAETIYRLTVKLCRVVLSEQHSETLTSMSGREINILTHIQLAWRSALVVVMT